MSRITVAIPEEKDQIFRKLVIDVYGVGKGALAMACNDAIDLYIDKYSKPVAKKPTSSSLSSQVKQRKPLILEPEKPKEDSETYVSVPENQRYF